LAQWENKGWWSTDLFLTLSQIGYFFFINELIKEDGSLLSFTDLKNNYNINIFFLEYHSIILSIPQEFKSMLRDNQVEKLDEICNKHILLLRVSQKVVKPFYKIFIQKVFEKPLKSQNKWMTDLNITEEENWDTIYQLPFKRILSTKLQSFQYKLNLRILDTNSMLLKCGLSETELCSYYLETKESSSTCSMNVDLFVLFGYSLLKTCGPSVALIYILLQLNVHLGFYLTQTVRSLTPVVLSFVTVYMFVE